MQCSQLFFLAAKAGGAIRTTCGVALVFAAAASTAWANPPLGPLPGVPEMDPSSAVSAIAMVAGGVLLLTNRVFGKQPTESAKV